MGGTHELRQSPIETSMTKSPVQTATLGMGCFWSPDALFGHLPGVIRTRVGYAGGTTVQPTYRKMGDHTESVEMDFDPDKISYAEILDVFWDNHNPLNINDYKGRQYMSLLLYHDEEQHETMRQVISGRKAQGKGEPDTEIIPYSNFHLAEDNHQKYALKRYPDAIEKLGELYTSHEELVNSTLAARLNGLAKGFTNMERIVNEIYQWPAGLDHREKIVDVIRRIRW